MLGSVAKISENIYLHILTLTIMATQVVLYNHTDPV